MAKFFSFMLILVSLVSSAIAAPPAPEQSQNFRAVFDCERAPALNFMRVELYLPNEKSGPIGQLRIGDYGAYKINWDSSKSRAFTEIRGREYAVVTRFDDPQFGPLISVAISEEVYQNLGSGQPGKIALNFQNQRLVLTCRGGTNIYK